MGHKRNSGQKRTSYKEKLKLKRKEYKTNSQEKRARLVIKNLPFKTSEESIREIFENYGAIKEVNLLKRPDGKLVGCGFVQFVAVQSAVKARHYMNGHELSGRKITCDFAVSKDRYLKKIKQDTGNGVNGSIVKIEDEDEEMKIKDEPEIKKENDDEIEIKEENDDEIEIKEENDDDSSSDKEGSDEDSNSNQDESGDEAMEENESDDEDAEEEKPPGRVISNDVNEGKTVFVKNIPFEATNDDLKKCMQQFGHIYYALICIDKLTEHSKGTGFVKFRNKEDAEKCLQAGTELKLLDNILDCHPAINKKDIDKQQQQEKMNKKNTDSRNLYFVKEGVILAGSKAAEGVSASDMAKRLQLEQYKTQMLRNLNMYISRNRLIVHNLPPSWNDSKLRELLKKHAGKKSVIKEAKIMRDMKQVDSNGIGTSKEYGFVTFTTHEHALNALRSLNNNPNVFTASKRPIVAFSIENRVMVKAKEKRLERSRQRNPLSKQYDPSLKQKEEKEGKVEVNQGEKYTGVVATPGIKKMRSRHNLKTQAKLHHETVKQEKKKKKNAKKSLDERKKDFTKQPRQKRNNKGENDNFSKMVDDYKRKLTSAMDRGNDVKKAKWYE